MESERRQILGIHRRLVAFSWLCPLTDLVFVCCTAAVGGHSSLVTSLAAHSDNNLLLSGSEDATAKLIGTLSGKVRT